MRQSRSESELSPWWGTCSIEEGRAGKWDIGPSSIWLMHRPGEWRVLHDPAGDDERSDHMVNRSHSMVPATDESIEDILDSRRNNLKISRHSFRKTGDDISLLPALADRPIISRPEQPIYIPAGESVTLYLSTPLWIRIQIPDRRTHICEVPSFRMSDTWFGPSTRVGELCYATRTSGRLQRENVPLRLHRAVTPVTINNKGEDALYLERIQLPAPHLSIFVASNDELWTEAVIMTRRHGIEGAGVDVRSGAPSEVAGARRVQSPRQSSKKGLFTSTFGAVGALLSP